MRYFIMKQDVELPKCIAFRDFSITKGGHLFTVEDYERLNDNAVLYLKGNGSEAKPSFIEHPIYMIENELQSIVSAYEEDAAFKDVIFIHKENNINYRYSQLLLRGINASSDKTEYYPNGVEKKVILDADKIGGHHLFLLEKSNMKHPIVSLAVVESFLRRNARGILFEEVEVQ